MNENQKNPENPPAFPTFDWKNERVNDQVVHFTDNPGMSLRDYFAAKALAGILANKATVEATELSGSKHVPVLAQACYTLADAMLAERSKPCE